LLLYHLTMDQFAEMRQEITTAILSVGALEEHGPHLPLGLDAMHALAQETGAPASNRVSWRLRCFTAFVAAAPSTPGTVGISGDVLRALIHDIGRDF